MDPEEDIVEDVAEDEGRMCWRQSVVILGGTNCLRRYLPWRRFLVTTIMCKKASPTALETTPNEAHPPTEDTRVLIVAARSSSTTWDSLLSLNDIRTGGQMEGLCPNISSIWTNHGQVAAVGFPPTPLLTLGICNPKGR
ncbi:hypothetical protein F7725_024523, partial [Dissostichus mawsoni]